MSDPPFWPDGVQGAVSLTFDDALVTQLDNAIPVLEDNGFRGTFYVNPGRRPTWKRDLPRWQQASQAGHEIGNHTADHPCSCNFGFRKDGYCLENLTLDDLARTIDDATAFLDDAFPEQNARRSFAYPCYQSYVGSGVNRQSYVPLVARRFPVARGWGERANDPRVIDLAYTWSFAVQGHTARQMVDYIESALETGWWAIVCMHGVGGQHISITDGDFRGMVDHLACNRDRIWTGTMLEVADYVVKRRTQLAEA